MVSVSPTSTGHVYSPCRTSSGPSSSQPLPPNQRGLGCTSQSSTAQNKQTPNGYDYCQNNVGEHTSGGTADLEAAEQTPGRHRCSHCSSSVYGAHTQSLSGSRAPHRLALAASEVVVDICRSSGAVWTGGGWDIHSPGMQT